MTHDNPLTRAIHEGTRHMERQVLRIFDRKGDLTRLIWLEGIAIALLLAQMWLLWTILARLDRSP